MPQEVTLPGVGPVSFDDSLSPYEIEQELARRYPGEGYTPPFGLGGAIAPVSLPSYLPPPPRRNYVASPNIGPALAEAPPEQEGFFRGFGRGFGKGVGELEFLPFVGGLKSTIEAGDVFLAARRLAEGGSDPEDIEAVRRLKEEMDREVAEQEARTTGGKVGYTAGRIVSALPGYAGEFFLTGGTYTAGKLAAREGLEALLRTATARAVRKAAGEAARKVGLAKTAQAAANLGGRIYTGAGGAVLQAPLTGIMRIPGEAIERMTPEIGFQQTPYGETPVVTKPGESFGSALANAYTSELAETASERAGGVLGRDIPRLPFTAAAELAPGLARTVQPAAQLARRAGAAIGRVLPEPEIVRRARQAGAVHGPFQEFLEERAAAAGHALVGQEPWASVIPSGEQAAAELLGFAALPIGGRAIGAAYPHLRPTLPAAATPEEERQQRLSYLRWRLGVEPPPLLPDLMAAGRERAQAERLEEQRRSALAEAAANRAREAELEARRAEQIQAPPLAELLPYAAFGGPEAAQPVISYTTAQLPAGPTITRFGEEGAPPITTVMTTGETVGERAAAPFLEARLRTQTAVERERARRALEQRRRLRSEQTLAERQAAEEARAAEVERVRAEQERIRKGGERAEGRVEAPAAVPAVEEKPAVAITEGKVQARIAQPPSAGETLPGRSPQEEEASQQALVNILEDFRDAPQIAPGTPEAQSRSFNATLTLLRELTGNPALDELTAANFINNYREAPRPRGVTQGQVARRLIGELSGRRVESAADATDERRPRQFATPAEEVPAVPVEEPPTEKIFYYRLAQAMAKIPKLAKLSKTTGKGWLAAIKATNQPFKTPDTRAPDGTVIPGEVIDPVPADDLALTGIDKWLEDPERADKSLTRDEVLDEIVARLIIPTEYRLGEPLPPAALEQLRRQVAQLTPRVTAAEEAYNAVNTTFQQRRSEMAQRIGYDLTGVEYLVDDVTTGSRRREDALRDLSEMFNIKRTYNPSNRKYRVSQPDWGVIYSIAKNLPAELEGRVPGRSGRELAAQIVSARRKTGLLEGIVPIAAAQPVQEYFEWMLANKPARDAARAAQTEARSALNNAETALRRGEEGESVQFDMYTTAGADEGSQREVFLQWPSFTLGGRPVRGQWTDGHGGYNHIKNPIVRIRYNIRTLPDGRRILFVEEFQGPVKHQQAINEQEEALGKMPRFLQERIYDLGLKYAQRLAVEKDLDGVSWTRGYWQGYRYGLHGYGTEILYRSGGGYYSQPGDSLNLVLTDNGRYVKESNVTMRTWDELIAAGQNPATVGYFLEDIVPGEVARRIRAGEGEEVTRDGTRYKKLSFPDGIVMGGYGLAGLYDRGLQARAGKIPPFRRAGLKVETVDIPIRGDVTIRWARTVSGNYTVTRQTPGAYDAYVMQDQPLNEAQDKLTPEQYAKLQQDVSKVYNVSWERSPYYGEYTVRFIDPESGAVVRETAMMQSELVVAFGQPRALEMRNIPNPPPGQGPARGTFTSVGNTGSFPGGKQPLSMTISWTADQPVQGAPSLLVNIKLPIKTTGNGIQQKDIRSEAELAKWVNFNLGKGGEEVARKVFEKIGDRPLVSNIKWKLNPQTNKLSITFPNGTVAENVTPNYYTINDLRYSSLYEEQGMTATVARQIYDAYARGEQEGQISAPNTALRGNITLPMPDIVQHYVAIPRTGPFRAEVRSRRGMPFATPAEGVTPFYSRVLDGIDDVKLPSGGAGLTPDQWIGALKNPRGPTKDDPNQLKGWTRDEVRQSGIFQWLREQEADIRSKKRKEKVITKEEMKAELKKRLKLPVLVVDPESPGNPPFDIPPGRHPYIRWTLPGAEQGSYHEVTLVWPYETEVVRDPNTGREVTRSTTRTWLDGHDQYPDLINPIVRLRYTIRAAYDASGNPLTNPDGTPMRVLFIEEIQGPKKRGQRAMPTFLKENIYELGYALAIEIATREGLAGVAQSTGEQIREHYNLVTLQPGLTSVTYQPNPQAPTLRVAQLGPPATLSEEQKKARKLAKEESPDYGESREGKAYGDPRAYTIQVLGQRVTGLTENQIDPDTGFDPVTNLYSHDLAFALSTMPLSEYVSDEVAAMIGRNEGEDVGGGRKRIPYEMLRMTGKPKLRELYNKGLFTHLADVPAFKHGGGQVGTIHINLSGGSPTQVHWTVVSTQRYGPKVDIRVTNSSRDANGELRHYESRVFTTPDQLDNEMPKVVADSVRASMTNAGITQENLGNYVGTEGLSTIAPQNMISEQKFFALTPEMKKRASRQPLATPATAASAAAAPAGGNMAELQQMIRLHGALRGVNVIGDLPPTHGASMYVKVLPDGRRELHYKPAFVNSASRELFRLSLMEEMLHLVLTDHFIQELRQEGFTGDFNDEVGVRMEDMLNLLPQDQIDQIRENVEKIYGINVSNDQLLAEMLRMSQQDKIAKKITENAKQRGLFPQVMARIASFIPRLVAMFGPAGTMPKRIKEVHDGTLNLFQTMQAEYEKTTGQPAPTLAQAAAMPVAAPTRGPPRALPSPEELSAEVVVRDAVALALSRWKGTNADFIQNVLRGAHPLLHNAKVTGDLTPRDAAVMTTSVDDDGNNVLRYDPDAVNRMSFERFERVLDEELLHIALDQWTVAYLQSREGGGVTKNFGKAVNEFYGDLFRELPLKLQEKIHARVGEKVYGRQLSSANMFAEMLRMAQQQEIANKIAEQADSQGKLPQLIRYMRRVAQTLLRWFKSPDKMPEQAREAYEGSLSLYRAAQRQFHKAHPGEPEPEGPEGRERIYAAPAGYARRSEVEDIVTRPTTAADAARIVEENAAVQAGTIPPAVRAELDQINQNLTQTRWERFAARWLRKLSNFAGVSVNPVPDPILAMRQMPGSQRAQAAWGLTTQHEAIKALRAQLVNQLSTASDNLQAAIAGLPVATVAAIRSRMFSGINRKLNAGYRNYLRNIAATAPAGSNLAATAESLLQKASANAALHPDLGFLDPGELQSILQQIVDNAGIQVIPGQTSPADILQQAQNAGLQFADPDTAVFMLQGAAGLQPGLLAIEDLPDVIDTLRTLKNEQSAAAKAIIDFQRAFRPSAPGRKVSTLNFAKQYADTRDSAREQRAIARAISADHSRWDDQVLALQTALEVIDKVLNDTGYRNEVTYANNENRVLLRNIVEHDLITGELILHSPLNPLAKDLDRRVRLGLVQAEEEEDRKAIQSWLAEAEHVMADPQTDPLIKSTLPLWMERFADFLGDPRLGPKDQNFPSFLARLKPRFLQNPKNVAEFIGGRIARGIVPELARLSALVDRIRAITRNTHFGDATFRIALAKAMAEHGLNAKDAEDRETYFTGVLRPILKSGQTYGDRHLEAGDYTYQGVQIKETDMAVARLRYYQLNALHKVAERELRIRVLPSPIRDKAGRQKGAADVLRNAINTGPRTTPRRLSRFGLFLAGEWSTMTPAQKLSFTQEPQGFLKLVLSYAIESDPTFKRHSAYEQQFRKLAKDVADGRVTIRDWDDLANYLNLPVDQVQEQVMREIDGFMENFAKNAANIEQVEGYADFPKDLRESFGVEGSFVRPRGNMLAPGTFYEYAHGYDQEIGAVRAQVANIAIASVVRGLRDAENGLRQYVRKLEAQIAAGVTTPKRLRQARKAGEIRYTLAEAKRRLGDIERQREWVERSAVERREDFDRDTASFWKSLNRTLGLSLLGSITAQINNLASGVAVNPTLFRGQTSTLWPTLKAPFEGLSQLVAASTLRPLFAIPQMRRILRSTQGRKYLKWFYERMRLYDNFAANIEQAALHNPLPYGLERRAMRAVGRAGLYPPDSVPHWSVRMMRTIEQFSPFARLAQLSPRMTDKAINYLNLHMTSETLAMLQAMAEGIPQKKGMTVDQLDPTRDPLTAKELGISQAALSNLSQIVQPLGSLESIFYNYLKRKYAGDPARNIPPNPDARLLTDEQLPIFIRSIGETGNVIRESNSPPWFRTGTLPTIIGTFASYMSQLADQVLRLAASPTNAKLAEQAWNHLAMILVLALITAGVAIPTKELTELIKELLSGKAGSRKKLANLMADPNGVDAVMYAASAAANTIPYMNVVYDRFNSGEWNPFDLTRQVPLFSAGTDTANTLRKMVQSGDIVSPFNDWINRWMPWAGYVSNIPTRAGLMPDIEGRRELTSATRALRAATPHGIELRTQFGTGAGMQTFTPMTRYGQEMISAAITGDRYRAQAAFNDAVRYQMRTKGFDEKQARQAVRSYLSTLSPESRVYGRKLSEPERQRVLASATGSQRETIERAMRGYQMLRDITAPPEAEITTAQAISRRLRRLRGLTRPPALRRIRAARARYRIPKVRLPRRTRARRPRTLRLALGPGRRRLRSASVPFAIIQPPPQ